MKFSLRSLMIVVLVLPPVIAGWWYLVWIHPPFRTADWAACIWGPLVFLLMLAYVVSEITRQQKLKEEQKGP